MVKRFTDLTPLPAPSQHLGSGPRRYQHPVYVEQQAPCNHSCQAGEDIRGWLALAQTGAYQDAFNKLVEINPFPAIHGRVCYHPCESACNRNALDATVSIHAVERFLGDLALTQGWPLPMPVKSTGKRVLVVGAGPAGLSAAYHLARQGHTVEIHESGNVAGGMMMFGIPAYRLPRDLLQAEISRVLAVGVTLRLNQRVDDVLTARDEGRFDAVFVGIGAHLSKKSELPASDAVKVLDALQLLKGAESHADQPLLGRKVVVYGGGNTAMDSARTAKRLGADDIMIVYRRDRAHMPAHAFELEEALAEGVQMRWLTAIHDLEPYRLQVEQITLDAHGKPQPTGVYEEVPADALVLAIGQESDAAFLKQVPGIVFDRQGLLAVDAQWMTGHAGIFAGGDMVTSTRTVTHAVGLGRKAANAMHAWLMAGNSAADSSENNPADKSHGPKQKMAGHAALHLPLFTDTAIAEQPHRSIAERTHDFGEIVGGLNEAQARYEAQRCLSCGKCYECDNCFAACPQQAIVKLGKGKFYDIDLDRCTGCAVCFEQCPCHAIEMQPEASNE